VGRKTMTQLKMTYDEKIEYLAVQLKTLEKDSFEWQDTYTELYKMIYPKITKFCDNEVRNLKNNEEIRACELDYYSVALSEVLVRLVNDFDPNATPNAFMKLYYYRVKKAFINLFKSATNQKHKALLTGKELKDEYFGEYADKSKLFKEKTIYDALEEFVKIHPKAKILYAYELGGHKATERIKKELGIEKYTSTERVKIFKLKDKLYKYMLANGYAHLF
jgi:hypothetical protein